MQEKPSRTPSQHDVPKREFQESWEAILPYLEILSGTESRSGNEGLVREHLMIEAEKLGIETKTDKAGNLWLLSDAPESEILLCSHMDKVGVANKAVVEGETVRGRLDDALGTSIIMATLKKGYRPSVLFTVEEESGFYGSNFATHLIASGDVKKPKLALILDVSKLLQRGAGPLMYTSSRNAAFPEQPIKEVKKILERIGLRATFLPGYPNDSISFTYLPNQGVMTIQVHVDEMHTKNERADLGDINEAATVLEAVLLHHAEISEVNG